MQVSYTCHLYWPHITKNLYCASFLAWLYIRVPWKARRSNQSILKEINPEYSLEGLMLKLKLQYFGHLTWRANSLEKILMLGKIDGRRYNRGWDGWMASPIHWTWTWANYRRWWGTGKPGMLQSMGLQRVGHDLVTEQQFRKVKGTVFQTLTFSIFLPFLLIFQGWHWLMKTQGTAEPGQIQSK